MAGKEIACVWKGISFPARYTFENDTFASMEFAYVILSFFVLIFFSSPIKLQFFTQVQ